MREVIEKLLLLQECDRKILQVQSQLDSIPPRRNSLQTKAASSQAVSENAKQSSNKIESDRKKLELEVEGKKQLIEKYSLQQFQTKKNEEFRALAHEIDNCKAAIVKLEDEQLELMEKAEHAQKALQAANQQARELKAAAESQLADLIKAEQELNTRLADLEKERVQLLVGIDEGVLNRYERLLQHKGGNVVVGIDHGICGGCHMKFPFQIVVTCQAQQELVNCPNCGRILYYHRDMAPPLSV